MKHRAVAQRRTRYHVTVAAVSAAVLILLFLGAAVLGAS